MIVRNVFFTVFLFVALSCNSKKTATDNNASSEIKTSMTQEEMLANGFVTGSIEESTKEGDCPFTIKITGEGGTTFYYDPTNLGDEFKKDGMEVIFTFRGLRMMNRCDKANPIQINEIQAK